MNKILILIVISLSLSAQAANWDLFPLNQKTYFKSPVTYPNATDEYTCVMFDSNYFAANVEVRLNMHKWDTQLTYGCGAFPNTMYNGDLFDSLYFNGDTVSYHYAGGAQSMIFLPRAAPGDSWTISGYTQITFTCVSMLPDTVLGVPDSVKTFSMQESSPTNPPLSNYHIRISKNFGLIDFIKFNQFFYHSSGAFDRYVVAGISDSNQVLGFVQPVFNDYMIYQQGDVMKWNIHFENTWPYPGWDDYSKDSITSIVATPDSFTYYFDEWYLSHTDTLPTYTQGLMKTYYADVQKILLESPPYSQPTTGPAGAQLRKIWSSGSIYNVNDTVTSAHMIERTFFSYFSDLDILSCLIWNYPDYSRNETWNTDLGFVYGCDAFNSASTCTSLTGAVFHGVQYGNTNLPVGITTVNSSPFIRSYPSPANDLIYFDLKDAGKCSVQIYNSIGCEIMRIENYSSNGINVSGLATGIYTAIIRSEQKQFYSRILKL